MLALLEGEHHHIANIAAILVAHPAIMNSGCAKDTVYYYSMQPTSPTFRCSACGHEDYDRVVVERSDATRYPTEFIACGKCQSMFWRPELARTPRAPDLRKTWLPAS